MFYSMSTHIEQHVKRSHPLNDTDTRSRIEQLLARALPCACNAAGAMTGMSICSQCLQQPSFHSHGDNRGAGSTLKLLRDPGSLDCSPSFRLLAGGFSNRSIASVWTSSICCV